MLQPDVLVARRSDLTQRELPAAPLLAVEVLSRSTSKIDQLLKPVRYAASRRCARDASNATCAIFRASLPRDGAGFAGLLLGIIGVAVSPMPFFGLIAIPCGVLALSFGLVGRGRQRLGIATNGGMATIGAGLGVIAIGIGAWWLVVLNDGYNNLKG